jgi:hypothetical protein
MLAATRKELVTIRRLQQLRAKLRRRELAKILRNLECQKKQKI